MEASHDEQWIKEKYEEICRQNPADYVLISLKIKRFRIFNRLWSTAILSCTFSRKWI